MYTEAINKIQLFEVRVKRLREGGSGMDADPDVLLAASSLAKEMEYSLSISTPSGPEKTGIMKINIQIKNARIDSYNNQIKFILN